MSDKEMSMEEIDGMEELDDTITGDSSPPEEVEESEQVENPDPEETEEAEESTEDTEEEAEEEEPEQSKGIQKRINQLTAQKHQERQRAEEAERRIAELEARIAKAPTDEPKLEDFDYDEDAWVEAVVEHRANAKAQSKLSEQTQKQQEQEKIRAARDWQQRIDQAKIPDYAEKIHELENTFYVPPHLVTAIQSDDKGPELAYYLADHLDVAEKIVAMNPVTAAMALGKISARLSAVGTKQTTKAPKPIKPLKTGGKVRKTLEDMTMEEIDAVEIKRSK